MLLFAQLQSKADVKLYVAKHGSDAPAGTLRKAAARANRDPY